MLLAFVTPLATGVRTAAALHAGPAALTWMLSAMSVGLAVALLTAGVLADDRGRRRVFVAGLVLLGAASAVAGAAGHPGVVIAARLVEGVGRGGRARRRPRDDRPRLPDGARAGARRRDLGRRGRRGYRPRRIVAVVLDGAEGTWRVTYAATAVAALVLAVSPGGCCPSRRPGTPSGGRRRRRCCSPPGMGALLAGLVESRSGTGWLSVALLVAGVACSAPSWRCRPAAGAADRSGPLPVARVRRRHRRRARRRDRGGRRRVVHADRAAARPRRRAAGR